jgi:hypothetical protein
LPHVACKAPCPGRRPESFIIKTPSLQHGRYLVSPLIRNLTDGRFHASVSIRSGHGSATHDRVLRLTPTFPTHRSANDFALREGLAWVEAHGVALPHVPCTVMPLLPREVPRLRARIRPPSQRPLLHVA